jgi:hypothetical protein
LAIIASSGHKQDDDVSKQAARSASEAINRPKLATTMRKSGYNSEKFQFANYSSPIEPEEGH